MSEKKLAEVQKVKKRLEKTGLSSIENISLTEKLLSMINHLQSFISFCYCHRGFNILPDFENSLIECENLRVNFIKKLLKENLNEEQISTLHSATDMALLDQSIKFDSDISADKRRKDIIFCLIEISMLKSKNYEDLQSKEEELHSAFDLAIVNKKYLYDKEGKIYPDTKEVLDKVQKMLNELKEQPKIMTI